MIFETYSKRKWELLPKMCSSWFPMLSSKKRMEFSIWWTKDWAGWLRMKAHLALPTNMLTLRVIMPLNFSRVPSLINILLQFKRFLLKGNQKFSYKFVYMMVRQQHSNLQILRDQSNKSETETPSKIYCKIYFLNSSEQLTKT